MLNWDEYGKEENVTPQSTPTVNNEVVKQAAEVVAEEKPTIQKIDKAEAPQANTQYRRRLKSRGSKKSC